MQCPVGWASYRCSPTGPLCSSGAAVDQPYGAVVRHFFERLRPDWLFYDVASRRKLEALQAGRVEEMRLI